MTIDRHVNGCDCRIDHRDYITADGVKNLATYLIDPDCYQGGVRAGAGMLWRIAILRSSEEESNARQSRDIDLHTVLDGQERGD